jgi:guanylate kinase
MKGKLVIFTAPSGAGKTTVVRHLLSEMDTLAFSVSATSRRKREHEEEGKDYYFLNPMEFRKKAENGEFLEWEEVYPGQYYGTLKSELERLWKEGKHIIFDIDVKGACNIKENYPEALGVFVKPPSAEVLFERLRNRGTETPESYRKRVKRATLELTYEDKFDVILLNDDLETALKEAEQIIGDFLNEK